MKTDREILDQFVSFADERRNVDDGVWYDRTPTGSMRFEVEYAKRCDGVTDEEFEMDGLGNCSWESEYFRTRPEAIRFAKKQYSARVVRVWLVERGNDFEWEQDLTIWE